METQSRDRVFYVLESRVIKYVISDAEDEARDDMISNLTIVHDDVISPTLSKLSPSIGVFEASEDAELAASMENILTTELPLSFSLDNILDIVEEITMEYNEEDLLN